MNQKESTNFFITQEMIIRAEQNLDWMEIRESGRKTISGGGKVIVGVTEFVKLKEFENWLAMAEEHGK